MRIVMEKLEPRRIFSVALMPAGDGEALAGAIMPLDATDIVTYRPHDTIELARFRPQTDWVRNFSESMEYSAWINWGDGREHRGYVTVEGDEVVVNGVSCYPEAGTYSVTVVLDFTNGDDFATLTHTTSITSTGLISHAVPRLVRSEGETQIAELEWQGVTSEMAAGEWIVGLSRDLADMPRVYMGWDRDYPGVSNFWSILMPQMRQLLDQTGLQYEWKGFLGSHSVFALRVAPETTHAQLHEALKNIPGYFSVSPNGIVRGGLMPIDVMLIDPIPPHGDALAPTAQADDMMVRPSAPRDSSAAQRIARDLFASDDILERSEPVLN